MRIVSESANDTLKLGKKIAKYLGKGDILCLFGEFGAGKTVLTKGIALGLGIKQSAVISPSFVLVRQYAGAKLLLNHLDLYRLKTAGDILALGHEDYLYGEAVTVIEWAERLGYLLPEECLKVELSIRQNSQRLLEFSAIGARYKELLGEVYREAVI